MKIICSQEEADILMKNCVLEDCEFCFLRDACHEASIRATIKNLIQIDNRQEGDHE